VVGTLTTSTKQAAVEPNRAAVLGVLVVTLQDKRAHPYKVVLATATLMGAAEAADIMAAAQAVMVALEIWAEVVVALVTFILHAY
jgi:hypothetical protein